MLEKFLEKNAHEILDECQEAFENGDICECYLQGVSDAVNRLVLNVLDHYYEEDNKPEEYGIAPDEVADVVLDMLTEEGASLSELAFAEKVLNNYINVTADMLSDMINECDEEECEYFLA